MSKPTVAEMQAKMEAMEKVLAELTAEKAKADNRTFVHIYESAKPGGPSAYGYIDLDKVPEGTKRLRIALWAGRFPNKHGEACLYQGEVTAADEPALKAAS